MSRRADQRRPIEPIYFAVGDRVREARSSRGVTQAALGGRIGHTRLSVVGIENARQRVQLHTLVAIADVLGVAFHELLPRGRVA